MATMQQRIADLITAIGTDYKTLVARIGGDLTNLNTTTKASLIAAINEVNNKPSGTGGAAIADGDAGTSTTTTYSANKITALNSAQDTVINGKANTSHTHTMSQITDAATKANDSAVVHLTGAETVAGVKTFSSAPVVPDGSFTIAKTTGLQAAIDAKPAVNDAALNTSTLASGGVWSPAKVTSEITAAKNAILGAGVPAALDTLDELAAALGDDANFAGTVTTGLSNRLRIDAATQGLTLTQQQNGRTNLNAYGSVELGNPDTDLVALYTAAKA